MADNEEKWDLIIEVHNWTKALILDAEEIDPRHEFFWPPLVQQRDALDHIVRAQRAALHPDQAQVKGEEEAPNYVVMQLDKALGHAYRAFFDVADWFSIIMRERISEVVSQYSRPALLEVMPNYSTEVESRVDDICAAIAKCRMDKDIGGSMITGNVQTYTKIIEELSEILRRLRSVQPKLDKIDTTGSRI